MSDKTKNENKESKIMRYTTIEINFRDSGTIEITDNWDDFDFSDGFIIIKNKGAWVAGYNLKDVFSFVLK